MPSGHHRMLCQGSVRPGAKRISVRDIVFEEAIYYPMEVTPDPHGQAAFMLCDGLILLLVETGVIEKNRAIDVIEGIIEVKQEIAGVSESVVVSMASIALLQGVARSLAASQGPG